MRRTVALLSVFLASACASQRVAVDPPTAAPAPPTTAPPAPATATALTWVRASAEHEAAFLQTYALATKVVEAAAVGRQPRTWAIVTDADETILDNSGYEQQSHQTGRSYPDGWAEWIGERRAGLLPGAAHFLARVRALGGVVVVVTNRKVEQCDATGANLRDHGIEYDAILCKDGNSDKNPRFRAVAAGDAIAGLGPLDIVMFLGDNIQDFPDLRQVDARDDVAALAQFGRRFFILPNPLYGSWLTPEP